MLYLKAYQDDQKLDEIKLEHRPLEIGRSPDCDLVLPDVSVSRKHARIEPHGNFYMISDNNSTNGTYVNDRAVQTEIIRPGDAVRIGRFILRIATSGTRGDTSKIRIRNLPSSLIEGDDSKAAESLVSLSDDMTEETRAAERLVRLYEIHQDLGHIDSLDSLLDRSLARLLEELEADRGCILLVDFHTKDQAREPEDLLPSSIASRKESPQDAAGEDELVVPEQFIRFILEDRTAAILRRPRPGQTPDDGSEGAAEAMAAPFLARDRLIGLVYLERDDVERPFAEGDLQFLTLNAAMIAVNLTNAVLFDEIFAEKEKLQAVIAGLSEGVLLTDGELGIIEVSAQAARLLNEEENPVGKSFRDVSKTFNLSLDFKLITSELAHGSCRFQMDERGGERTLDVRIAKFTGPVSGYEGHLIILSDASERRKIEEKKYAFVRNIAHKLRTPLTLIEGNVPLLRGELQRNTQATEILDDVEKGSRTLCDMVDDFVNFMEMEIQNVRSLPSMEERDLADLAWEAICQIQQKATEKRLLINNKLAGDLPTIRVRSARFVEALTRILENAVKFSPDGSIIVIDADRDESAVRMHIIDEGPGIPPSDQDAVFEVFHQIDRQGTGEVAGLGLGLAIAREIVLEHGGDIQITSPFRAGRGGTRITLVIPVLADEPIKQDEATAAPERIDVEQN